MEPDSSPVARRSTPLAGRLVVCPTPIGNLGDITARVHAALRDADVIACEDTRRTGTLLKRLGLSDDRAELVSLHEHNEPAKVDRLLARMIDGQAVALVSDAGTPLISDPGYLLLKAAIDHAIPVEVLPGPSAAITALVASGLPPSRFRFEGFLPRGRKALAAVLQTASETVVALESPRRVQATLSLLAEIDPERPVAVCRELTKLHEEVIRGAALQLATRFADDPPKGEVVLVIGPAPSGPHHTAGWAEAEEAVRQLVQAGARRGVAARVVAPLAGLSAKELYSRTTDPEGPRA